MKTRGHGSTPTTVTNGPNSDPKKENVRGTSINLLLISSAVTALVMKKPAKKTNSHSLLLLACI
jgi:hypothetical protein